MLRLLLLIEKFKNINSIFYSSGGSSKMKIKIIGILVCTLLITTILPMTTLAGEPGNPEIIRRWYMFATKPDNNPPTFVSPSPVNGSTGNLLSLSWSILINDPEGDTFSWTIQCNNGQTSSGTGATNGTKSLLLLGLAYSTTYKVWVNATDPTGSGLSTRRWYLFSTKWSNYPLVFSTPFPLNNSKGNALNLYWSILINDPEGDTFSWTIQCNNGHTSSGTGATNGTKSLLLLGLAYSTTYKVWVNATDPTGSGLYTRRWFQFTTQTTGAPPVFGVPSPTNGSTGRLLSFSWSIPINDPEGNSINWWIQCSNGQRSNGTGASNGTKSLSLSGLAYSTTYKVWVNATDPTGSGLYTRKWYTFTTTQQQTPPNKPNTPDGSTRGKPGISYTYQTSTTDPDGDLLYYTWDWGDGTPINWTGLYNSAQTVTASHIWSTKGSYSVKVKAKDTTGAESVWSDPLPITMPYSYDKSIPQFLEFLFQRFPNAFPILRHIVGY
jgi:PKD domain